MSRKRFVAFLASALLVLLIVNADIFHINADGAVAEFEFSSGEQVLELRRGGDSQGESTLRWYRIHVHRCEPVVEM